jgi:hypothetical protein
MAGGVATITPASCASQIGHSKTSASPRARRRSSRSVGTAAIVALRVELAAADAEVRRDHDDVLTAELPGRLAHCERDDPDVTPGGLKQDLSVCR